MIRLLRAFAWLRWRLLRNGIRGGKRRDLGDRFSRISQVVVPALMFLLLIPSALGLGVLGLVGGMTLGAGSAPRG